MLYYDARGDEHQHPLPNTPPMSAHIRDVAGPRATSPPGPRPPGLVRCGWQAPHLILCPHLPPPPPQVWSDVGGKDLTSFSAPPPCPPRFGPMWVARPHSLPPPLPPSCHPQVRSEVGGKVDADPWRLRAPLPLIAQTRYPEDTPYVMEKNWMPFIYKDTQVS